MEKWLLRWEIDLLGDQEKSVPRRWERVSPLSGTLRRFDFFAMACHPKLRNP